MNESKQSVYLSMKLMAFGGILILALLVYYLSSQTAKPDIRPIQFTKGEVLSPELMASLGLKKQFTYMNFWASWCEPCKEELPLLERWNTQPGHETFQVVLINVDEKIEDVQLAEKMLQGLAPNVRNFYRPLPNELINIELAALPKHLIIDPNGKIVEDFFGTIMNNESKVRARLIQRSQSWQEPANP